MIDSVGEVVGIVPGAPFLSLGSYAEYLVVPAEGFVQRKPENLDFEQAASLGLAALTALVGVEAVEPFDGDVVLVVGATGGVGAYSVQLANGRGATVVARGAHDANVHLPRASRGARARRGAASRGKFAITISA